MIILMGMIIVRAMHMTTNMIMTIMTSIMHMDIITIIIMTIAM